MNSCSLAGHGQAPAKYLVVHGQKCTVVGWVAWAVPPTNHFHLLCLPTCTQLHTCAHISHATCVLAHTSHTQHTHTTHTPHTHHTHNTHTPHTHHTHTIHTTHTHTYTCRVIPLLIKLLHEYCQCANDLPMLITDVVGKLLELLKVCVRVCKCVHVCIKQFFATVVQRADLRTGSWSRGYETTAEDHHVTTFG